MNVLITGGAGFIGSHLAEELIKRGDKVYVVDDLSTGRIENLSSLLDNPQFSFMQGSILNEKLMAESIEKCELVYHLAAAVGVKYIMENRLNSIQTNVRGTEIVLELASKACLRAKRKDKKKVMLASTSEVYGKNGTVPFNEENDSVLGPTTLHRWSYSCTKMMDEFLALAYFKEKQLPIVIMRFFNTVGPRQLGRYGMVVPRFIKRALSGAPLQVYGDGTQTRCFTYISDVIRAMVELATVRPAKLCTPPLGGLGGVMASVTSCSNAVGEVFNIGSEEEISIKDLAKKIIKLTGSSSEIKYIPYEKAYGEGFEDMKRRVPDISKIKRFIGWQPEVSLDELLKQVIVYEREQLDNVLLF